MGFIEDVKRHYKLINKINKLDEEIEAKGLVSRAGDDFNPDSVYVFNNFLKVIDIPYTKMFIQLEKERFQFGSDLIFIWHDCHCPQSGTTCQPILWRFSKYQTLVPRRSSQRRRGR